MIKLFESKKKKPVQPVEPCLGLCLSGGGALGFAHIGVLSALIEHGIEPDVISGSSMGAIVGTFYAAGILPAEMMKLITEDRLYKITKLMNLKPSLFRSGFSDHSTVRTLIREIIPHNSFEGLNKKLFVCVSNLSLAQWEIKSSGGDLDLWVSASASIPGVFGAFETENTIFVDGGLLNNFPAQPLQEICTKIIGVDVLPHETQYKLKKPVDSVIQSIRTVEHVNSMEGRTLCDHLIEPQLLKNYHEFRFDAYLNIYKQGYKDCLEYIKNHPEILDLKKK